jgi:hypothetical protein
MYQESKGAKLSKLLLSQPTLGEGGYTIFS